MSISSVWNVALCLGLALWLCHAQGSENSCTRADGRAGFCVDVRECPRIDNLRRQPHRSYDELHYIRNSRCIPHKRNFVCCEAEEEEIPAGVQLLMEQKCGMFGYQPLTIAGSELVIASRPWMALLKFHTKLDGEQFLCSGTLITKRFILTAAHCLKANETELVSVRLGKHRISTPKYYDLDSRQDLVQDFDIESVFIHEEFSEQTLQNDIALVKLSTDVEFTTHIQPICLPVDRTLQQSAEELPHFRLTGWGRSEHAHFYEDPTEVITPRKQRSECEMLYNTVISESQICAGSTARDASNGDGGAPLSYLSSYMQMERFVQFGIVSYGTISCVNDEPQVYTNVGSFIPWIADKISNS